MIKTKKLHKRRLRLPRIFLGNATSQCLCVCGYPIDDSTSPFSARPRGHRCGVTRQLLLQQWVGTIAPMIIVLRYTPSLTFFAWRIGLIQRFSSVVDIHHRIVLVILTPTHTKKTCFSVLKRLKKKKKCTTWQKIRTIYTILRRSNILSRTII